MRISHVALDDFRSYRHQVCELPAGVSVFVGHNGQGKTNLVEAIAYLSTFSSHRVAADTALVRVPTGEEAPPGGAMIRVKLVTGEHTTSLSGDNSDNASDTSQAGESSERRDQAGRRDQVVELEVVRGKANRARLNRTTLAAKKILGMVRTVVFAPEDLSIVRDAPQVRRRFIDECAIQLHPTFSAVRADFDRVARQRAAVLKAASARVRRGQVPDLSTLEIWDDQFVELSAQVTLERHRVVMLLSTPASDAYSSVADSPREFSVGLEASVSAFSDIDVTDPTAHIEALRQALQHVRDDEVRRGVNLVGAHRDDLELTLGHLPVKGYASHGESWSAALALRLASFEVLSDEGERPILILDDVFAELDAKRRQALVEVIRQADQVLITAAVESDVPDQLDAHIFRVHWDPEDGSVIERE